MYGLSITCVMGSEFDLARAIKLTKNLPYSKLTQIFEVYPYLLFEIDKNRRIDSCYDQPSGIRMTFKNIESSDLGWPPE